MLPFSIVLQYADPWAVMTAYNKVNGTHVVEDRLILKKVLLGEWGYKGLILSDW